jgi:hypothetical protein
MANHIFIPQINLTNRAVDSVYVPYLSQWRENIINMADDGKVCASYCLQAAFIELVLEGRLIHDWIGIMDKYLTEGSIPLAYSERFGELLYKFSAQYKQSTIHAIYTKWWIQCLTDAKKVDHSFYADLILRKKQTDGLFYDKDISETILRHRMKTELTMSGAMGIEILRAGNKLTPELAVELATDLVSDIKCPQLGYMSMELFRLQALKLLNNVNLFPIGIEKHIDACAEGLAIGWCDFAMRSKVDSYMGTAKRTQRDKPIHSPLITCYVQVLAEQIYEQEMKEKVLRRVSDYANHLKRNPFDISAFQMRDIPVNFGTDKTPIEIICASYLSSLD